MIPDIDPSASAAPPIVAAPSGPGRGLTELFFRTLGWGILDTAICGFIIYPPFAPITLLLSIFVGPVVGIVLATILATVTGTLPEQPASRADYVRTCRRTLDIFILMTVGIPAVLVLVNLAQDAAYHRNAWMNHDWTLFALATLYGVWVLVACLFVNRRISRRLANKHINLVWPGLA